MQGESRSSGFPTVFVRLTGCPLRCQYCDTAYAFEGGDRLSLREIIDQVTSFGAGYVTVTGGEPLAQPDCLPLMSQLCDMSLAVSLETSGALDIASVDDRVSVVMDLKTPGSKEAHRNRYENIPHLQSNDQVKFVICDRQDYDWAKFKLGEYDLINRVSDVLFSASHEQLEPRILAEWILEDCLPVRMQVQLHKYLWGDKPGV